jgi:hypothetical protein
MIRFATVFLFNIFILTASLLMLAACGGKQFSVDEFHNMAREVEEHTTTIAGQRQKMRALLQSYNQTVAKDRRLDIALDPERGLTETERERLAAHIEDESDPSCCGLLEQMLELQSVIDERHERVHEITAQLPAPHRVRSGENHYTLCMDYLTGSHQLSRANADSLVARVGLTGDIIEGFHVWFYYDEGMFGTFVTQGEAQISPTVFAKVVKRHLLDQARRQGRKEAFETILDSLKRSGALLANIRQGASGL